MKRKNKYYDKIVTTNATPLVNGDRDTIIKFIYDIHLIEWYTTYLLRQKITGRDVQDKIQEIYLMICEIPQEKWDDLYEQGKYSITAYVTGLIHQQLISQTSYIYKKYKKYRDLNKITDNFWDENEEE